MRAAEALGCNTLQANNSTVAKLCNQSIPPVPTGPGETLQVKHCWRSDLLLCCAYLACLLFVGGGTWWVRIIRRSKSADFVVYHQGHNKRSAAPPIQCTWSCARLDPKAKVHSTGDCLRGSCFCTNQASSRWRQERESSLWGATGRWTGRRSPSTGS